VKALLVSAALVLVAAGCGGEEAGSDLPLGKRVAATATLDPTVHVFAEPVTATLEVVVDSAFVGMRKPEPRIYELTLERLGGGLRAEDCVFLDDIEVNCEAARALGMTAVHFEHADQAIPALESALAQ